MFTTTQLSTGVLLLLFFVVQTAHGQEKRLERMTLATSTVGLGR